MQLSVNDTEIQTILIEERNSSKWVKLLILEHFELFTNVNAIQFTFYYSNIDATDSTISIDDKEWTFVLHSLDLQEIERLQISENDTFTISMQGNIIIYSLSDS